MSKEIQQFLEMDQRSSESLLAESPACTSTGVKQNSRKRTADVMDTVPLTPLRTRKETVIWLVGQNANSLKATKLPSRKEVMSYFFYQKNVLKKTTREACHSTADEVILMWSKARIPIRLKKHVVDKVQTIFKEWEKLKKNKENKAKRSEALKEKEETWKKGLEELFDIAHSKALTMIKIQEDKEFLLAQREPGRRGIMGNVDKSMQKKEERAQNKYIDHQKRKALEAERQKATHDTVELVSSSSESDEPSGDKFATGPSTGTRDDEPPSSSVASRARRGRKQILNPKLAVSLDMAKLSDRGAALVLIPALQSIGHDPAQYNISHSSIRRERIKHRQKIAQGFKSQFKAKVPLTIHWDGKLLEDISGREVVDRLPVFVSGEGVLQLLAVPKLPSGTGEAAASAVFEASASWGIGDKVKCMSFDTTSANTGLRSGACTLLEKKMGKDLLWLACRHHMLEIVLESVVTQSLGHSQAPEILLFKRFKKTWSSIDASDYQTSSSDAYVSSLVSDSRSDIVAFVKGQLLQYQPRDDYRELLQLTTSFLSDVRIPGEKFKAPAGLHRARWMAKAIYAMKIWMLREQFKLTKQEEKGIRDICLFTVLLYVRAWFTAPSASCAPRLDLQLLKDIDRYKSHNQIISASALKKLLGHLWYLSPVLVAFAFFDDDVPCDMKRKMVLALQVAGDDQPVKRAIVDPAMIHSKELDDFVSSTTRDFFSITGLSSQFLDLDVEQWDGDNGYKSVKATVRSMKVVNDIAERGVALMDEFNKLITNDEEQKQYLLLVVQRYRQKYADRNKSTLIQDMS